MESILYHCLGSFSPRTSLFSAFFFAGLTGGVTHCVGMCGTMAASEALNYTPHCSAQDTKRALLSHMPGWSYHLGRFVAYGGLGFTVAFFSKQIAASSFWPWVSALMLTVAGLMFLKASIPSCRHKFPHLFVKRNFIQGMLLGFMPCGLLYAALMMAATLANPFEAMVAMWLFVLGTMPSLLVTASGIHYLARKWKTVIGQIGRAVMVFNGLSLLVIAAKNVM